MSQYLVLPGADGEYLFPPEVMEGIASSTQVGERVAQEIADSSVVRGKASKTDLATKADKTELATFNSDTAIARANRLINAASICDVDFIRNVARVNGIAVTRYQALKGDTTVRTSGPRAIAPRATTNLMGGLPLSGGTPGVLNSGGVLPTRWDNNFSGVPKELLAITSDSITLKLGPSSGGSFGGVRISPVTLPTGPSVFTMTFEPGALPAMTEVPALTSVGWFKDGVLTATQARVWWTGDNVQRVSVILPTPAAGSVLFVAFSAGVGAPSTQQIIVTLGKPSLHLLSEVGDTALGQPPFTATSLTPSSLTLNVPNGEHILVALDDSGQYIRSRVTVSGGAGLDVAAALNGWYSLRQVWVIPNAAWDIAMSNNLEALSEMVLLSPMVRIAGNESSAAIVMRGLDKVQNPGEEITNSSADAARTTSVLSVRNVPNHWRFFVAPGDKTAPDGPTQERAEIHIPDKMPFDTPIWFEDWVIIDEYPIDPSSTDCSTSLLQLRYTNDPGDTTTNSPEFTLRVYPKPPSSFEFYPPAGSVGMAVITNSSTTSPSSGNANNLVIRKWTSIELGKATHFVGRLVVGKSGSGAMKIWQDGVVLFDGSIPLGHIRQQGPQFRIGAYSNKHTTSTRRIQHRGFRYSLSSLEDRVYDKAPL